MDYKLLCITFVIVKQFNNFKQFNKMTNNELKPIEFEFSYDQKVTNWYRTEFTIEANNLEEAKEKAIEFVKNGSVDSIGWDEVENGIEYISVDENGGNPTNVLFCDSDDFNEVWNNQNESKVIKTILVGESVVNYYLQNNFDDLKKSLDEFEGKIVTWDSVNEPLSVLLEKLNDWDKFLMIPNDEVINLK